MYASAVSFQTISIYPSGHHYFTLKDSESSLRCVMFKSSASKLRFRPESGMGVTAWGRVAVYPRDGAYQLYCTALMPEGTGDLQVAFEQLKAKLSEEGLFDRTHKKPLPEFPERIAIITSSAGAAVHDMIRILGRRWPMTKVLLLPVRVQGVEAPPEIVGAIRYANEFDVADLIITGRGGGSIEDLWAFNDERVARAIYESRIPVISAVGHEPDVTISDYVADRRASTPSNAAEIAVPDQREIAGLISGYSIREDQAMRKKLAQLSGRLESFRTRQVIVNPTAQFDNRRLELDRVREA
ncbi:MAG: exodeoxyribonuclease VII large subunit [Oscillospiraceae bacterium]